MTNLTQSLLRNTPAGTTAIILALLLALFALMPGRAQAHANIVESNPAANSVLDSPPKSVTIRFTETLEPALSQIRVLDSLGNQVDLKDSALDPNDSAVMRVSLATLTNGAYTVAWTNVSTVDGHRVRGSFTFSVGEPLPSTALEPADEQPLLQSSLEPFARWLALTSGLALVGVLAFRLLVSTPALAGMKSASAVAFRSRLSRNTLILTWAALAIFLSASALRLIIQASIVYDTSMLSALTGPAWSLISETEWGRIWAMRVAFALASGVALFFMRARAENSALALLTLALGAGALFSISRSSHAAALAEVGGVSMLNDFIHLMGVAVWVGGLFSLALDIPAAIRILNERERRETLSALIPRFSIVAAMSVAVLALTGIYSAWTQVGIPAALDTPYGRTLIVKIGLICALLAIAAVNLIWVRPRLSGSDRAAYWLRRLVAAEALVAVLILLSVGFLTALEPARQTAARLGIGVEDSLTFSDVSEGADISVEVTPGRVGLNTITISLRDDSGRPIANADDVRVRISYLDADLGETEISAPRVAEGEYALTDQTIGIAGAWEVAVVVQRPDAFDARTAFRFETATRGGASAIPLSPDSAYILLGGIFGVLGLMFMLSSLLFGGFQTRAGAGAMSLGVLGIVGAAALLASVLGDEEGIPERNPVPQTSESVAAGLSLYATHCQLCHGDEGLGDGPASAGLNPTPANLIVHVPLHPDRALFDFIHDGVEGSAMPPLSEILTDEEIWHIVNYIRTLEDDEN